MAKFLPSLRREGATQAAGKLQTKGLIRHSGGRITVIHRPRLESRVSSAKFVAKREYDRLLAPIAAG